MPNPETIQNWYHHNFNPFFLTFGDVGIPWYWLNYVLGWFWCDFIVKKWAKSIADVRHREIQVSAIRFFMLLGWILMLVGARLAYVFIYNSSYFISHPDQILAIWNGGMSFHGGVIGVGLAATITAARYNISFFSLTDPIAFAVPPIIFLGRLANFINGELPGRPSQLPWAVIFPPPFDDGPRHPSQLYEAAGEGLFVGVILFCARNYLRKSHGAMTLSFVALYSLARFLIEFFRQPDPQIGLILGLSLGQWLSSLFFISSLAVLLNLQKK